MADDQKAKVEQDAHRIINWLTQQQEEFEQNGVEEASLAGSVGLGEEEILRAIDHLENHEEVVRLPQGITTPPRFLLKPGRAWRDRVKSAAGEGRSS
jgi:hypothetical protein